MNNVLQPVQHKDNSIFMIMLAVSPILNLYYVGPFTIAEILFMVSFVLAVYRNTFSFHPYPKLYFLLWAYLAIHLVFFFHPFKVTYLIPGGIRFFIFSISIGVFVSNFDIQKLNKYLNLLFIFSAIAFLYQFFSLKVLGTPISMLLPLADKLNYANFTYDELRAVQLLNDRPSSFFAEPSYFGQFCLIVLCIDFFSQKNIEKVYTPLSIFIIIILLLSRTGAGFLGLIVIVTLKSFYLGFMTENKTARMYFFLLFPVVIVFIFYYMSSEIGRELLERTNDISSAAGEGGRSQYLRLFAGWIYLSDLDIEHLITGATEMHLVSEYEAGETGGIFFNGVTYFILMHGVIGFALLVGSYIHKIRGNGFLSISAGILLLVIGLFEAIYIQPLMLLLSILILVNSKQIKMT